MIFIGKEPILFYEFNDLSTFSRTINKPMELGVDIIRSKLLIVSLFMITMYFWLLPIFAHAASRGISVISDLSHQSGKLGAYKALIIGINDYKDPNIPDLETSVNDANAMANLLRERYGFEVKLLLDHKATREAIYRALRSLASSTEAGDSVLIYYAGHGDLDRLTNDGWWIPADAKGGDPVTYLNNFLVQTYMRSMKARHVLLISDSCYSGTLFGQTRAIPQVIDHKYYLNLYNEKSRWGMTSGNKTPVSDQGAGGHSVFAYQLLKALRKNEKPYISTQELYTRIAPLVSNNSEQTPLCRPIRNTGDQGGEFVFVASTGKTAPMKESNPVEVAPAQSLPQAGKPFDEILEAENVQHEDKEKRKEWQQADVPADDYSGSDSKIETRGGTFIAYATGVIYDKITGLEWYAGPDKSTNWNEAKRWVENLNVAGGNWRMPTRKEIKTLFKRGEGTRNMTPLLKTSGWWVWSRETQGSSSAWAFAFIGAGREILSTRNSSNDRRGFAVRLRRGE